MHRKERDLQGQAQGEPLIYSMQVNTYGDLNPESLRLLRERFEGDLRRLCIGDGRLTLLVSELRLQSEFEMEMKAHVLRYENERMKEELSHDRDRIKELQDKLNKHEKKAAEKRSARKKHVAYSTANIKREPRKGGSE